MNGNNEASRPLIRVLRTSKDEEGSPSGEAWVVARAASLLIGALAIVTWVIT